MRTNAPRACAVLLAVGAMATALAPCGCKVSSNVRRGSSAPLATARAVPAAPSEAGEPRSGAPVEKVVVDPDALAALRASGRLPVLALADVTVPSGLTTVAMLDTARTEARGASAIGGIRPVELQEGQRAEVRIPLAEGDCLTLVAHAGLGVREVDAFVVEGTASEGTVLGQDTLGGPLAILGGQAGCLRIDRAREVLVVVLARKGSGLVLAAIFRGAAPPAPR